jgi:hypothetical protein
VYGTDAIGSADFCGDALRKLWVDGLNASLENGGFESLGPDLAYLRSALEWELCATEDTSP